MEADFQREYGIDLSAELGHLSWRRFLALLVGLGPTSRWALLLSDPERAARPIADPVAAERAVERLLG